MPKLHLFAQHQGLTSICCRYANTQVKELVNGYKFIGLRSLEGATVCIKVDANVHKEDSLCENACCPENTCDTAPTCTSNSLTGEKDFDGKLKPLAMHSK